MTETFGERVRRLRMAKGWSGAKLAQYVGVSEPAVSYWENDHQHASVANVVRLSRLFGVSIGYLETGSLLGDQKARDMLLALHRAIRARAPHETLLAMIGGGE